MQITLRINGEDKTFTTDFISGRMFRRSIEMQKHFKSGADLDEQTLDEMAGFVVDAYGKQFTLDQFYDGIPSDQLISTITKTINAVVGRVGRAAGGNNDPNQSPAQQ